MSGTDVIAPSWPGWERTQDIAFLAGHLTQPIRILILLMLHDGEPTVTELCRRLGKSRVMVSQHLRRLRNTGVVEPSRRGAFKVYSLTPVGSRLIESIRAGMRAVGGEAP